MHRFILAATGHRLGVLVDLEYYLKVEWERIVK